MDLIRRIRWTNVARAAAVVGVLALIAAWPQLREEPPSLPPEPAVADTPPPREQGREFGVEEPRPAAPPVRPAKRRAAKRPAARRGAARRERRRPRSDERRAQHPAAPVPAAPVRTPPPARPTFPAPAPAAATEFGFE